MIPEIEDEILCCPYCGSHYGDRLSCCGESTEHGVKHYVVDGVEYTEEELDELISKGDK